MRLIILLCFNVVVDADVQHAAAQLSDFRIVPGGRVHKSCLYELPDGTSIGENDVVTLPNGTAILVPPCRFPHVRSASSLTSGDGSWHGYAASAWAFLGKGEEFTYFSSNFNVPEAPSFGQASEMTYLFNGLEDSGGANILQPVLQYSGKWTGGDCYPAAVDKWGFRSFYVSSSGNAYCGTSWPVDPGQTVTGTMKKMSAGHWDVWAGVGNEGYTLHTSGVNTQVFGCLALELWYPTACEAYPGKISFSGSMLQTNSGTITPSWQAQYDSKGPSCGQHVQVDGTGGVTITSNVHSDQTDVTLLV